MKAFIAFTGFTLSHFLPMESGKICRIMPFMGRIIGQSIGITSDNRDIPVNSVIMLYIMRAIPGRALQVRTLTAEFRGERGVV